MNKNYRNISSLPSHIGRIKENNYCNMDEGLLDYLIDTFKIKTLLDVGCANGDMVAWARSKNIEAYGIDGDYDAIRKFSKPSVRNFLIEHDYTTGLLELDFEPNVILSIEFLEHVEEQFLPNILNNFTSEILVICTPPPGSPGYHHVNCQPKEYWIEQLSKYTFDPVRTKEAKEHSTMTDRGKTADYFRKNGMIFIRK